MFYLMPIVFLMGIIAIAFEDKMRINKSATALLMCVVLWLMLIFDAQQILVERQNQPFLHYITAHPDVSQINDGIVNYLTTETFVPHLGDVSGTLFFVMCSLLIVKIIDKYGGFLAISHAIQTPNKRRLLWYICLASFFFSALLDNLAAAIVLLAILRKIVLDPTDRIKYACMVVISANAGGSWSPIGDVTTLLLWTGGNISAAHQILHLFLPAFANLLVTTLIAHFWLFKKNALLRQPSDDSNANVLINHIPHKARILIFWIGILSLVMVPVFQTLTHLPAFMCVLLGLVFLWIFTDLLYGRIEQQPDADKLRISSLTRSVDIPTIFFFLGVLMSVAALNVGGQLTFFANKLSAAISQPNVIAIVIGAMSSLVDNVALVAATMGMYPIEPNTVDATLQAFVADGSFWTLLAYCAVTGGSIFIIGSATGVAVMGMEKISFGYYLKRFTPLAIVGYLTGIGVYLLF